jgi:hypothetical protein
VQLLFFWKCTGIVPGGNICSCHRDWHSVSFKREGIYLSCGLSTSLSFFKHTSLGSFPACLH